MLDFFLAFTKTTQKIIKVKGLIQYEKNRSIIIRSGISLCFHL